MKKNNKTVTKQWFEGWSNEYDSTLGSISFHKGLLRLVVQLSGVKENDQILDLGCGTGLLSLKLLQAADCSIIGIDSSKEMLSIFKDKIKKLKLEGKISCRLMDIGSLKFKENTFDLIVSTVTLHHLKNKIKPFQKIYSMLKPGGRFVVGEVDMDTTGEHTDIHRFKRILETLKNEWIPALKEVGVEAFSRMFVNGKKHILNEGEYCLSMKQWSTICKRAGFESIKIQSVPHHPDFKALVARKSYK